MSEFINKYLDYPVKCSAFLSTYEEVGIRKISNADVSRAFLFVPHISCENCAKMDSGHHFHDNDFLEARTCHIYTFWQLQHLVELFSARDLKDV